MLFRRRFAAALLALAAVSVPSAVRAEKPKLHLQRVDTTKPPLVQAFITYVEADGRVVQGKTREDFKLVFDSTEQGSAQDVKTVDQSGEKVYVVVVAQISQAMHDVFDDDKRGIKQILQATADMKGSKASVITYAQDVKRVVEIDAKPDAALATAEGIQEDATGAESHLLDAIRMAIDVLNSKGVPDEGRKQIIVFSDGIDVSGSDKSAFSSLGKRANIAKIVINTIGYAPFEQDKLKNLAELSKQTNGVDRKCKSAQEVGAQFSNAADELRKQYRVVFQSVTPGDSKEHTVQVSSDNGGTPLYSETVTVPWVPVYVPPPPTPWYKTWWFITIAVLLGLAILGAIIYAIANREPAPEPVQAPAPEPVKEAPSPQRTMAIDLGGGSKGPTIGWIVGLNGQYTEKTYKLKPLLTQIGSAPEADIVVQDPKVSRRHCEIRFDGNTYKIVDVGSTNGVVLNDKRTPSSELVDGDTFRLGSTEFKFKSVN